MIKCNSHLLMGIDALLIWIHSSLWVAQSAVILRMNVISAENPF